MGNWHSAPPATPAPTDQDTVVQRAERLRRQAKREAKREAKQKAERDYKRMWRTYDSCAREVAQQMAKDQLEATCNISGGQNLRRAEWVCSKFREQGLTCHNSVVRPEVVDESWADLDFVVYQQVKVSWPDAKA